MVQRSSSARKGRLRRWLGGRNGQEERPAAGASYSSTDHPTPSRSSIYPEYAPYKAPWYPATTVRNTAPSDRASDTRPPEQASTPRPAMPRPAVSTAEQAEAAEGGTRRRSADDSETLPHVLSGLALRELTLVESLLGLVEDLERREEDPGQLAALFQIDHLATRMRRNGENLLVLAGRDDEARETAAVPLLDVTRAAMSEIAHYERVHVETLPRLRVVGPVVDDVSHILAELLDNATAKSPQSASVTVRAQRTGDDTLVIDVEDTGIGIPTDRLSAINTRLSRSPTLDSEAARHMGLFVVGRLAHRHGIRVQLRARQYGGTTAVVVVPARLVNEDVASDSGGAVAPAPTPRTQERRPAPPADSASTTGAQPVFRPGPPEGIPKRRPRASGEHATDIPGPRRENPLPAPAEPTGPPTDAFSPMRHSPPGEPTGSEADRAREDFAGFLLGQSDARRASTASDTEPDPPASTEGNGGAPYDTDGSGSA